MKRFRVFRIVLIPIILLSFMGSVPLPALGGDVLPDGCLGNLKDDQVVVYYFHRKFKCGSCQVVEAFLQNSLEKYYSAHFREGRLAMCIVNIDDPRNHQYLEQFQLLSTSLVIVKKTSGQVARFKHLDKIWDVSQDKEAVSHILQEEISRYLKEG